MNTAASMTPAELRAEADRLERAAKDAERAALEAERAAKAEAENRKRTEGLNEVAKKLVTLIGGGFTASTAESYYGSGRRVIVRKEGEKAILATIDVSMRYGSYIRRDGIAAVVFGGEHEPYGRGTKAHYRADKPEGLKVENIAARAVEFAGHRLQMNAYEAERKAKLNTNEPLAKGLLAEFGFEDYRDVVEGSTSEEGRVHLKIKASLTNITPERARAILTALRDLGVEL
jgi:hypothetical protein